MNRNSKFFKVIVYDINSVKLENFKNRKVLEFKSKEKRNEYLANQNISLEYVDNSVQENDNYIFIIE